MATAGTLPTNTTEPFDTYTEEDKTVALTTAGILVLLGLLGNGFICLSFCIYRPLRTVNNRNTVATADLLQMVTLACWILFATARPNLPQIMANYLLMSIDILCSSASMLGLAAVSLDRHYAITYSLQYHSIVTKDRTIVCVVAIWIYSATVCFLSWSRGMVPRIKLVLYNKIFITILMAFSFALPITVILYCYFKVFKATWVQMKKIERQSSVQSRQLCLLESAQTRKLYKLEKMMKGEIRLALNILVILAPMMFFWGTFYCITAFEAYCNHCIKIPLVIDLIIGYAPYFAATVNPIIYIFLTRTLRKILRIAIFRLFGSRARLRENQTNSSLLSNSANKESRGSRRSSRELSNKEGETPF